MFVLNKQSENLAYELTVDATPGEVEEKTFTGFCKILTFTTVALNSQLPQRIVTTATLRKSQAAPPWKTKPLPNATGQQLTYNPGTGKKETHCPWETALTPLTEA